VTRWVWAVPILVSALACAASGDDGPASGSGGSASGGTSGVSGGGFGGSGGTSAGGGAGGSGGSATGGGGLGASGGAGGVGSSGGTGATGGASGACAPSLLGHSYIGCEYYPTVTANSVPDQFHFAVAVSNTTNQSAAVSVTRAGTQVANESVAAGSVKIINLPWIPLLKATAAQNFPSNLSTIQETYRLVSTQPVTVYQFSPLEGNGPETNDASLLLPVSAWTARYRVMSRATWFYATANMLYPGFYAVTASEDDTHVKITASPTTPEPPYPSQPSIYTTGITGMQPNGNGNVVLQRGQTLQILSGGTGNNPIPVDLTGTLIEADKPVQVISGHHCTNIPHWIQACDHLEESMFPLETLVDTYLVTAPLIPAGGATPKVQMVRIVATADGTTLSYSPALSGAPTSIAKAGGFVEIELSAKDFQITANHPILVGQYMTGQEQWSNGQPALAGDPALALVVPKDQWRTSYLFHAPPSYEKNYLNVVAPNGASVLLDGSPVSGLAPIGSTGMSVARVALPSTGGGTHTASSTSPLSISVYGYGQYTSYWYPGGLDLEHLSP
jgi:hypothetical protein